MTDTVELLVSELVTNASKDRQDNNLIFCTKPGGPLDAGNVRRAFRGITRNAGIEADLLSHWWAILGFEPVTSSV